MQGARRRRRIAALVLAGLTGVGLVVAAVQLVATVQGSRQAHADADAALAVVVAGESHLDHLQAQLDDAASDLRVALADAAAHRQDLHARVADRDDLTRQLTDARAQLVSLQSAISGTEVETEARTALVGALGTCLDGVTALLNQVSVGDGGGAARTASAIGPACATVGTVLG